MKLFLQDFKNLANILQEKRKIIFLQDLIKIMQENYLTIFSCKISYIFQEKLQF